MSQALSLVPTFSSFHRDLYTPSTAEARYVAAHASYIQCVMLLSRRLSRATSSR